MKRIVGIASCIKKVAGDEGLSFHAVPDPYVAAAAAIGALPVLIPALGDDLDLDTLFATVDGVILTGSVSNVSPDLYGGKDCSCPPYDHRRDVTAMRLIHEALARDVPLLAICRGIQELNVALGGTLYPRVHEVAGRFDHRSDRKAAIEAQFAPAHHVRLIEGGWLRRLSKTADVIVNSLHGQGIATLAPGLFVEAVAPDGQIEAVRVEDRRFAIGVQWHPEWTVASDPLSRALFESFDKAMVERRNRTGTARTGT